MIFQLLQNFIGGVPQNLGILVEIGLIIIFATSLAFFVRIFKQPLIPAYIITGILIGPVVLGIIKNQELIMALSEIGVAFLIFTAGIEIKFKKLREVGKTFLIAGIAQIIILFLIAYSVGILMNLGNHASIYVGLVVAFSSTMIVVKLLSDKREINSLHGRIIIGILLLQDIIAIVALAVLSSDLTLKSILIMLSKALLFTLISFVLLKISNPIFRISAKNHELLLLVSVSFLFLFIIGSYISGLSLIIGAFFAGVVLANSDYKTEIQSKISSLREFFSVLFFVALGMQLRMISKQFIILFFVLLVLVMVVKPIVTMFSVRMLGYKKRTSFLTGNALAQTSEFSLIIVTLGFSLGYIDEGLFSTLVLLTIVTMSLTTYLISYEKKISKFIDWPLNILNRIHTREEKLEYLGDEKKKIIIFGCHRMGSLFLKEFEKEKKEVFVVDYNPEIIQSLIYKKVPCIYGDYSTDEIFEKLDIKKAEFIIITIPDFEQNLVLTKRIKKQNPRAVIFIVAERISEAMDLYKAGADYIILPQIVGGQKAFEILRKVKKDKFEISYVKKDHIKYLNSIHHILY
jgi:Kef-type K+ transport system membrane component KefB